MQMYVGKIDLKIYRCISDNIDTDEVVITERQIEHVMEGHPGDYEMFSSLLRAALESPDYIVEANRECSGLVLRRFIGGEINLRVVLRLHTSTDEPGRKNSVITFQHVSEKEYRRILKNKKVLYKKQNEW